MTRRSSTRKLRVRVSTPFPKIAYAIGELIEERLGARIELEDADRGYGLSVGPGLDAGTIGAMLRAIEPFMPPVMGSARLPQAGSVELMLGGGQDSFTPRQIEYVTATPGYVARLAPDLLDSGFEMNFIGEHWAPANLLAFGSGWGAFDRAHLLWLLQRHGVVPVLGASEPGGETRLLLHDPEMSSAVSFVHVETRCDSDEAVNEWVRSELAGGFRVSAGTKRPRPRFRLELGPLVHPSFSSERLGLEQAVTAWLAQHGVDSTRFPLQIKKGQRHTWDTMPPRAVLHLPIRAHQQGTLRPYAGDHPDRFEVVLKSDVSDQMRDLVESLEGFSVRVENLTEAEISSGFTVRWGIAESCPLQKRRLERLVQAFLAQHRLSEHHIRSVASDGKHPEVIVSLPLGAAHEGRIAMRPGSGFNLRIKFVEARPGWERLESTLKNWAFSRFNVEEGESLFDTRTSVPRIRYGGAPESIIEAIVRLVEKEGFPEVSTERVWGDSDHDIWLDLPTHPGSALDTTPEGCESTPAPYFPEALELTVRESLVVRRLSLVQEDHVVLGPWRLPIRKGIPDDHPYLPTRRDNEFCLDGPTFKTLEFLAAAVALRQPVLLEGHTGTTKTTAIEHLASLLRQPLMSLNLNGLTDTQELIGKPWLTADKRLEWRDGPVPIAMERGFWLCFDEGNLAGPNVLERLNAVVGRCPSLVLSEHDGRRIRGEGVHPDFRVFFTMNPAEFAGRSVLSPAWRDRFQGYRFCPSPGEREYYELLVYLVYGEHPLVQTSDGTWTRAQSCGAPAFEILQRLPEFKARLAAIARLHASLSKLTGQDADSSAILAVRKKEKHVFSRRGLLALLDFLAKRIETGGDTGAVEGLMREAVDHTYVQRMTSDADRATVWDLVSATGVCGDFFPRNESSDEADERGKG